MTLYSSILYSTYLDPSFIPSLTPSLTPSFTLSVTHSLPHSHPPSLTPSSLRQVEGANIIAVAQGVSNEPGAVIVVGADYDSSPSGGHGSSSWTVIVVDSHRRRQSSW